MNHSTGLIYGPSDLFGVKTVIGYSDAEIVVTIAGKTECDDIISTHHYSRSTVWSSSLHFLVVSAGEVIGAIQYGPAMNPASGSRIVAGTRPGEWLELNRMWLSDVKPMNSATRAIAFSLRVIRHNRPEVQWIQSFADERCGKLGGVYQAASFIYCGSHTATFYELDGEWYHKSMKGRAAVDKRGWGCGPKITYFKEHEHRAIPHTFRQFRYLKFINNRLRPRLKLPVLPYPKPHEDAA